MVECEECGKQTMSFTCRYCGNKYCSKHRLPENHNCNSLEESLKQEKQEDDKWFKEKEVKKPANKKKRPPKKSLTKDIARTLKGSVTLSIILITTLFFLMQPYMPGISPPITQGAMEIIQSNPMELNPLTLYPSAEYLIERPWTLLTVMLLHGSLFHIFANMITFYFFGTPLEKIIGGKELVKFYIGSGLLASIGFVAFRNLIYLIHGPVSGGFHVFGPAVGASGAVVAVFAAVSMLYPDAEVLLYFFIPMKIKTALYAFMGLEVFNLLAKTAGIHLPVIGGFASSAHLAGLLIGIWYGKKLREKHSTKTGVIDLLGY